MIEGLKQRIQERIEHAKERQQYWKEKKDIAKIWAGIESELTLVLRDLDDAAKQIQEKASDTLLWHKPTNSTVRLLESYVKLSEVLAILDGKEKAKI